MPVQSTDEYWGQVTTNPTNGLVPPGSVPQLNSGQGGFNPQNMPNAFSPPNALLAYAGASGNPLTDFAGLPGSGYTPTAPPAFTLGSGGGGGGTINLQSASAATPGEAAGATNLNSGDMQALRDYLASGAGQFDATPVWEAMKAAQQRGTELNAANLAEYFNVMGGRFSTSFGDAMTDYWTQTGLDQNALLGQMQMQAFQEAQNRLFGGKTQLAGWQFQSGENAADRKTQVSIANTQARNQASIAQAQISAQQAIAQMNAQLDAWRTSELGRQQMAQLGLQNSFNAASQLSEQELRWQQFLTGESNDLTESEMLARYNLVPHLLQNQYMTGNQALDAYRTQWDIYERNLRLGQDLGQTEWDLTQAAQFAEMAEWFRTQWQNNPLLASIMTGANQNQQLMYPMYPTTGGL